MLSAAARFLTVSSLVLLSLVAVAPLAPPSHATPDPSACPANPSPPKPNNPSVVVDRPTENQRVTSPVLISGRAQVFEAHLSITIFDASGKAIVDTFTLAEGMAEAPTPFSTQVPFTVATEQLGCIRVFESSAKDGSPINVVQRSVILSPANGPSVKPPSTAATPDSSACPANPSPPKPNNPSVIVDRPTENQRLTSPVLISGRAQVFEAHVSITIFDASGRAIVDTFTLAQGMAEAPTPFSAQVPFAVTTEQLGCIRVFESSAKDGSPINVVQRPVILSPTVGPSVKPPSTGDGGLAPADGGQASPGAGQVAGIAAGASLVVLSLFLLRRRRA
jgi:hypothetical protein